MSADFKTRFVSDAAINDITPELEYVVKGGAASTTFQSFPATTSSNSSLTFSIQVPSENVVLGRDAMIESKINFSLKVGSASAPITAVAGESYVEWGLSTSFSSFPISSNMNTANIQINNTSTSINLKDVLPQLLRLNDSRELYKYNSYAPSLPDQAYYSYVAAKGANNNPMASYNTASYDVDQVPRGAFPVDSWNVAHYGVAAGVTAFIDTSVEAVGADEPEAADGEFWIVNVVATLTEPIFVSPFTWSNPELNAQGLLGINNMAFNFTIDSSLPRLLSNANPYLTIVAGDARLIPSNSPSNFFLSSRVLMKFLSTQDTDRLQTKNVVPFMDFPRYITSQFNNGQVVPINTPTQVISNNIQLNQLPDYFIICVRKQMATQTIDDADAFFKINSVSFNLNNMSGLLSTASPQDLWRISQKNGSSQSWSEFGGKAWMNELPGSDGNQNIGTTGSLLVVSPTDLSLPSYLAPGSLGNFQLSLTMSVTNQGEESQQAELVVIAVNSGFMVTQMGQSSVYTGVLTREAVLDAKMTKGMSSSHYDRMVGGKMLNRVCTAVVEKLQPMLPHMVRKLGAGEMSGAGRLSGLY
jgi:hypothetical protein